VGLLLLRATVGFAAVIQGGAFFANRDSASVEAWVAGFLMALSGILVLIGFLTPAASTLVALGTLAIACSWGPMSDINQSRGPLPAILVTVISAAMVLLGPGAFSVDSRLFGRREIIIPHVPRPPGG
jgi:uncharacterized membrane protein YphA (DoxX/SURF4 family)